MPDPWRTWAVALFLCLLVQGGAAKSSAVLDEERLDEELQQHLRMEQKTLNDLRIVGGKPVEEGRHPYVVSFRDKNNKHFCGGSLISPRAVVTAAHCLDQDDETLRLPVAHLGRYYSSSSAEDTYEDNKCEITIIHKEWSLSTAVNDIALCILAEETTIQPVLIPSSYGDVSKIDGDTFQVMGWGSNQMGGQNMETLQGATVYKIDRSTCSLNYPGRVKDGMLCAGLPQGGADACQGDSGGPLINAGSSAEDDRLRGIVSWGDGCGLPGKGGVYTDAIEFRNWMEQNLMDSGMAPLITTHKGVEPPGKDPATSKPPSKENNETGNNVVINETDTKTEGQNDGEVDETDSETEGQNHEGINETDTNMEGQDNEEVNKTDTKTEEKKKKKNKKSPKKKKDKKNETAEDETGVSQPPGQQASNETELLPCQCSINGYSDKSNSALVGCDQFGYSSGDEGYYCYLAQPEKECLDAVASQKYEGAAWRVCDPTMDNVIIKESSSSDSSDSSTSDDPPVSATGGPQEATPPGSAGTQRPGLGALANILANAFAAWFGG